MMRWCGIDQQMVTLDAESRCSICGTLLGPQFQEDNVSHPHLNPTVQGNEVTEYE